VSIAMAREKITLKEEAISEILIADTNSESKNVLRLESHYNTGQRNHPPNCTVVLCSSHGQREGTVYKCSRCVVSLCVVPCLVEYHTKVQL